MKRSDFRFPRTLILPALAGGMLLAAASPLMAQAAESERNAPASAQPTEDQDGAAARARLNAEQADAARRQVNSNVTSQQDYERALQDVADAKARIAADAAAAQQAYEAEKARRDADYQAAMVRWQEDADACRAGKRSRCAPKGSVPQ